MSREFNQQASLVLNVALAVTIVVLVMHKSERAPAFTAREVGPEKITNETPVFANQPNQPKLPQYTDLKSASDQRRWIVDQLRAAGVPNDIVARFVRSDIDASWEDRLKETAEKTRGNPEAMAAMQLEEEKDMDAGMRAALGEEGYKQWDQKNMLLQALGCGTGSKLQIQLTASEADAIYDLKKKMQQRHWDLEQARQDGTMDDAQINDANSKAYIELNQQMKAVLGDERYAQSQGLDAGTAAANLKQDLANVNPSDSQFQDLLKAQQQLNDARSALDPSSPDYADQLKALDDARNQEYQQVLGADVFNTLQKQQDPGYSQMKKYETLWGLDDSKIDGAYGAIKYYEKSVQDYQAQASALEAQGQSVDWDAVNKNLQQFKEQTQQSLQTYLGQDSFNKMQQNGLFQFNQSKSLQ